MCATWFCHQELFGLLLIENYQMKFLFQLIFLFFIFFIIFFINLLIFFFFFYYYFYFFIIIFILLFFSILLLKTFDIDAVAQACQNETRDTYPRHVTPVVL